MNMKTHLGAWTLVAASVWLSVSPSAQDAGSPACTSAAEQADGRPTQDGSQVTSCPIIGQEQALSEPGAAGCAHGANCSACPTQEDASCSTSCAPASDAEGSSAPAGDVPADVSAQLVKYLENIRETSTDGTIRLDRSDLERTLGFQPERQQLMDAVAIVFPGAVTSGGASRCSDYGACSLYADLSSATGDALGAYEAEKQQDGRVFEQFMLPSFSARTLDGQEVSSDTLRGQPTLVVPIAAHCSHSYETLPILHEFAHTYGPRGLRVVGLLINSGSPEDATQSLQGFEACHDFWVTDGDSVGKLLQCRLVPSHFLVTADGQVVKKFVGFKRCDELTAEIEALLGA